jgi:hypothetical protein
MNDSEHDFISSEVLTDFGRSLGQSQIDPERLREVLTHAISEHPDQARLSALRGDGAHYFVVRNPEGGFELRLGHHDLEMLNAPGVVAGESMSIAVVQNAEIALAPRG